MSEGLTNRFFGAFLATALIVVGALSAIVVLTGGADPEGWIYLGLTLVFVLPAVLFGMLSGNLLSKPLATTSKFVSWLVQSVLTALAVVAFGHLLIMPVAGSFIGLSLEAGLFLAGCGIVGSSLLRILMPRRVVSA